MIRVLLIDGHQLFHSSIETIITAHNTMTFLGAFRCPQQEWQAIAHSEPDVILYTLSTINGIGQSACTHKLATHFPTAKLIALLETVEEGNQHLATHPHIFGLVSKRDSSELLCEAITAVSTNTRWVSPSLIPHLLNQPNQAIKLTTRETELLNLLVQAKTNHEIAETMHISERTVRKHLCNIQQKLQVERRTEVVVWAVQNGFLPKNSPSP
jgi:DNA-binding NarL/FixJ family response regulator